MYMLLKPCNTEYLYKVEIQFIKASKQEDKTCTRKTTWTAHKKTKVLPKILVPSLLHAWISYYIVWLTDTEQVWQ